MYVNKIKQIISCWFILIEWHVIEQYIILLQYYNIYFKFLFVTFKNSLFENPVRLILSF